MVQQWSRACRLARFNASQQIKRWKGKTGRLSKMSDQYIRRLLVLGMVSRIRQIIKTSEAFVPWFADILADKPRKLAAVAPLY